MIAVVPTNKEGKSAIRLEYPRLK